MKRTFNILLAALFVGATFSPPARAAAQAELSVEAQSAAASTQEETAYADGEKAMNEQRWSDAVTAFDRAATAKGKRTDASLYWKAYSLDKLGRKDDARATCDSLSKQQPSSTWNRECRVLRTRTEIDVQQLTELARQTAKMNADMAGQYAELGKSYRVFDGFISNKPATEDDIKILALNALMRQDPAKALPLLRDLLKSNQPMAMRKQALFVLSRSKDPQAQTILTEVAMAKGDPEMQREAIQMLALNRGKDAGPTLVEVYRGSTDEHVKKACINGLFLAHDAPRMVELARGEKDLNMKRDIVSQLSLMKDQAATDYMLELLK
jgi:tetratricopeptide (TPR) repeat protein